MKNWVIIRERRVGLLNEEPVIKTNENSTIALKTMEWRYWSSAGKRRWVSWWDKRMGFLANWLVSGRVRFAAKWEKRTFLVCRTRKKEWKKVEMRRICLIVLLFYAGVEFCRIGIGNLFFSLEITRKWETPGNCRTIQPCWRKEKRTTERERMQKLETLIRGKKHVQTYLQAFVFFFFFSRSSWASK